MDIPAERERKLEKGDCYASRVSETRFHDLCLLQPTNSQKVEGTYADVRVSSGEFRIQDDQADRPVRALVDEGERKKQDKPVCYAAQYDE